MMEIERHDDGYLAYFPALPGCHTWGKIYEAAVRYAEEALAGYLETLAKHEDPIPVETDAKGKGASGSNREAESTDAPERADCPVVAMKRV
jgi:predicted RNase H-like HicB family nuclease